MFEMIPVTSSNIKSVGYDAELSILYVQFHGGKLYAYKGVSKEVYDEFLNAESIGKYFMSQIKGAYDCVKIDSIAIAAGKDGKTVQEQISELPLDF